LGVRGIRLCLQHEDLFRTQLRALLRAGSYGKLKIMFPMIGHMSELRRAKELLAQCRQELRDEGVDVAEVSVGMMVEVPAAAVCAEAFAKEVDFFSIGTNDLTQYTLAVDRGNAALNGLCDYMHPAVLRLISQTIAVAHRAEISCGMCGEMAGDAAALELLSGYGLDTYSVSPGSIGRTKCGLLMQEQVCCSEADEGFLERLGR
jgi:Phosphoenolpyruvate-protein kinase (PTS system EI component in bacteria)